MLFSIIIATYNAEVHIQNSLDALVNQAFSDFEVIIKDADSRDRTLEIARAYKSKLNLKIIRKRDSGIYDAWNQALEHAVGQWIIFLGADDKLVRRDALLEMSKYLANTTHELILFRVQVVRPNGTAVFQFGKKPHRSCTLWDWMGCIHHQGLVHKSSLFGQFGCFDTSFKIAGDFDWLSRFYTSGKVLEFFETEPFIEASLEGVSTAFSSRTRTLIEYLRVCLRSDPRSVPSARFALLKSRVRDCVVAIFGDRVSRFMTDVFRFVTGRKPIWFR